jgi:glycosyltransferase involved in cell wall biosynthesis
MFTIDLRMYRSSGIGRYLRNLMPLVLPLVEAKHVRVVGSASDLMVQDWSKDPRVEVYESSAGIYGLQEQALALNGALRGTELLWVPHYSVPMLYSGRLAVTIHDVCHLALHESLDGNLKRMYARLLFSSVARRAQAIFCVSEFTSSEVQRYLHVPASRIQVTHPGLDAGWDAGVAQHRESDGAPYFLFVGNLKPNKNLGVLLKAFGQVIGQIPHRLIIVGKADNMKTVDGNVVHEAEKLSDRVQLTGEISDQRLMEYYRGAEALVFPSLYEGFGLPLLEAMNLGCPVLCSNTSALPEVGGDAVMYFNPRDADDLAAKLVEVARTPELRSRLVQRGLTRLTMFSYERCARQTAEVLNGLFEQTNQHVVRN